jgi:AcrR family transcriptional regulator
MNKKQSILKTAAQLFAAQGFGGTTTRQIAREAGVTEPLIYYHFEGKEDLFTRILEYGISSYLSCIDGLEQDNLAPFDRLRRLIELQFDVVADMPDEMYLIVSVCPVRLSEPGDICDRGLREYRRRLTQYLSRSIEGGVTSGAFVPVPVVETALMLFAFISGIMRYAAMNPGNKENVCQTAVDFCRRSLMPSNARQTRRSRNERTD